MLLEPGSGLRTGEPYHEEEPGKGQEGYLEPSLSGRCVGDEFLYQSGVAQTGEETLAAPEPKGVSHKEKRDQEQQEEICGLCQIYHTVSLLNTKNLKTSSRSNANSAISAKVMNFSE